MRTIMIGGKLMRGVETRIQEIRHRIFREVARMAYHTEWPVDKRIEELPYKIIPGEVGNFRNDVFLHLEILFGKDINKGRKCNEKFLQNDRGRG